jgi:hypothetical protein
LVHAGWNRSPKLVVSVIFVRDNNWNIEIVGKFVKFLWPIVDRRTDAFVDMFLMQIAPIFIAVRTLFPYWFSI